MLSSTWRRGWECKEHVAEPTPSDLQDIRLFDALVDKLKEYNIELMSYTEDFGLRGEEIDKWLSEWQGEPIESFIILDDMGGAEMRPHSLYLVQTGFREGLQPKHVQKAIKLLNEWDEPKIIRNRAKCLLCGDIIESTDRHDFKMCSCGALSVDGGLDYIRRCYKSEDTFEELTEYKEKSR